MPTRHVTSWYMGTWYMAKPYLLRYVVELAQWRDLEICSSNDV